MASSLHYSESPYLCCGVGLTCAGEAEPLWGYCAVTGKVKNRSVLRTGCEPVNITANGPGPGLGFKPENFPTAPRGAPVYCDPPGPGREVSPLERQVGPGPRARGCATHTPSPQS